MHAIRTGLTALFVALGVSALASAQATLNNPAERGYLGIMVTPAANGILVNDVTPDSPAAKAGMKKGDHIVKLANNDIKDIDNFLKTVATKKPGDKLELAVNRDGKDMNMTVPLGKWPLVQNTNAPPLERIDGPRRVLLGVQTESLTSDLKKRLNVEADKGVVVTEVIPNSPAAKAGLKPEDVITSVDKNSVASPADLSAQLQKLGSGKAAEIHLLRGKEKMTVKATLQTPPDPFSGSGFNPFPMNDVRVTTDPNQRIRDLERKVDDLEKRLNNIEKEKK